ncbi:MAG: ATP-binding protein [Sandaracinaceae bacterium]
MVAGSVVSSVGSSVVSSVVIVERDPERVARVRAALRASRIEATDVADVDAVLTAQDGVRSVAVLGSFDEADVYARARTLTDAGWTVVWVAWTGTPERAFWEHGIQDVVHPGELWRLGPSILRSLRPAESPSSTKLSWYYRALERLVGFTVQLTDAGDLDELALRIDRASRELLGATGGTLLTLQGRELVVPGPHAAELGVRLRRDASETWLAAMMTTHDPTIVPDVRALPPARAARVPAPVRSFSAFPVWTDHPLGALVVYWSEPHEPASEELAIIGSIAALVAGASDNLLLRLELERRVADRTAQLDDANRALDAFNAAIVHDLRSPAINVTGFAEALLEDGALDDESRALVERIARAGHQMSERIEALHSVARAVPLDLEHTDCDLTALAYAILDELVGAEPDRRITVTVQQDLSASIDSRIARVILENLLRNAIKFTRPREVARIQVGRDDALGAFYVRDDGVGFDPSRASELFKPFRRLCRSDEFEGSGVGLSIVRRVVTRSGGRIWAEGAIDAGATFYFTIPTRPAG